MMIVHNTLYPYNMTMFERLIKETRERKAKELRSRIGKEGSCNFSPTGRAKLISINVEKNECILEATPTPYKAASHKNVEAGKKVYMEIGITHNMYFY